MSDPIELIVPERKTVELTSTAKIPAPQPGWSLEMQRTPTHLQVREVRDDEVKPWVDVVALSELAGPAGAVPVFAVVDGALAYRFGDSGPWAQLMTVEMIADAVSPQSLAQAVTAHLAAHPLQWGDLAERPEAFPPEAHEHALNQVDGLGAALAGKSPLGHTHDAASLVGLNATLLGLGNVDNTRDADKQVSAPQAAALALKAGKVDVQTFVPSGALGSVTTHTWNKPAGARFIEVRAVCAGGGGGAGGVGAVNAAVSGGGGGGGGNLAIHTIPAALLPSSVPVQVGRGGAGGNPSTGTSPGRGGTTRFGSFAYNEGWNGNNGSAGGAGNGGSGQWGAFTVTSAPNGGSAPANGTAGVSGSGSSNNLVQTTGGGSGAGLTAANAVSAGGTWGATYAVGSNPAGAGASGGGRGTDGVTYFGSDYGTGGGGGGSSITGNGGEGGHGAPGGGGGGGGAARTGFLGGVGGNGGDARVTVTAYF